jgi:uncharacterized membrane protein (UPF0136 family)
MSAAKILLTIYGVLMLVGGWIGYAKAGSKASLITGIVSGILILIGVYLSGPQETFGQQFLTVITALLTFVFVIRLIKTHSFMPSGMLLIMSLIAFFISLSQLIRK